MTPEQFHRRHVKWYGRFDDRVTESIEDCWYCGRNQSTCRSKLVYPSLQEALDAINQINYPGRDRLVVTYGSCPWGEDQHWHLTTATRSADRRRARKLMSKRIRLEYERGTRWFGVVLGCFRELFARKLLQSVEVSLTLRQKEAEVKPIQDEPPATTALPIRWKNAVQWRKTLDLLAQAEADEKTLKEETSEYPGTGKDQGGSRG